MSHQNSLKLTLKSFDEEALSFLMNENTAENFIKGVKIKMDQLRSAIDLQKKDQVFHWCVELRMFLLNHYLYNAKSMTLKIEIAIANNDYKTAMDATKEVENILMISFSEINMLQTKFLNAF